MFNTLFPQKKGKKSTHQIQWLCLLILILPPMSTKNQTPWPQSHQNPWDFFGTCTTAESPHGALRTWTSTRVRTHGAWLLASWICGQICARFGGEKMEKWTQILTLKYGKKYGKIMIIYWLWGYSLIRRSRFSGNSVTFNDFQSTNIFGFLQKWGGNWEHKSKVSETNMILSNIDTITRKHMWFIVVQKTSLDVFIIHELTGVGKCPTKHHPTKKGYINSNRYGCFGDVKLIPKK